MLIQVIIFLALRKREKDCKILEVILVLIFPLKAQIARFFLGALILINNNKLYLFNFKRNIYHGHLKGKTYIANYYYEKLLIR